MQSIIWKEGTCHEDHNRFQPEQDQLPRIRHLYAQVFLYPFFRSPA